MISATHIKRWYDLGGNPCYDAGNCPAHIKHICSDISAPFHNHLNDFIRKQTFERKAYMSDMRYSKEDDGQKWWIAKQILAISMEMTLHVEHVEMKIPLRMRTIYWYAQL
jgi:hypothetical protein